MSGVPEAELLRGWGVAKESLRHFAADMEGMKAWRPTMKILKEDKNCAAIYRLLALIHASLHFSSNSIERLFSIAKYRGGTRRASMKAERFLTEIFVVINLPELLGWGVGSDAAVRDFVERTTRVWLMKKHRRPHTLKARKERARTDRGLESLEIRVTEPEGFWAVEDDVSEASVSEVDDVGGDEASVSEVEDVGGDALHANPHGCVVLGPDDANDTIQDHDHHVHDVSGDASDSSTSTSSSTSSSASSSASSSTSST